MRRWRLVQYALVAGLVVFALWQFSTAAHEVSDLYPFRRVLNYWWLGVAIAAEALQYVSDGYFVRETLALLGFRLSLRDTTRLAALDVFGTAFLPLGQFGSMAAGVYLLRLFGLPAETVVFYDVAVIAVTAPVVILLFLAAIVSVPRGDFSLTISLSASIAVAVLAIATVISTLSARNSTGIGRYFHRILLRSRWFIAFERYLEQWRSDTRALARHGTRFVALVSAKDIACYALDVATIAACFRVLHTAPPIGLVAQAYMISLVSGYVAMTPAGIGAADAALALVFLAAGISPGAVIGVILLFRFVNVLLPAPFGAWSFYSLKRKAVRVASER